jgi:hypothetical protein
MNYDLSNAVIFARFFQWSLIQLPVLLNPAVFGVRAILSFSS